ncbi:MULTISPECIES: hypothetical protein [unclassified Solwaraspora]|uniref:hypothetical protein n=1 Tax=unclassified Solwaraspora TaxID=2627926 RepID=UPI00259BBFCD|nr:hypothetical protein [Solwaraspora sp. WMMA2056]WJK40598.1 hypothetical protein O7608_30130 [Solwaraspora sp. WMMA2056]
MSNRRRIAKPSLALWMLVALADVALLVASVGLLTVLLVVAGVVAVVGAVVGASQLVGRGARRAVDPLS